MAVEVEEEEDEDSAAASWARTGESKAVRAVMVVRTGRRIVAVVSV